MLACDHFAEVQADGAVTKSFVARNHSLSLLNRQCVVVVVVLHLPGRASAVILAVQWSKWTWVAIGARRARPSRSAVLIRGTSR